MTRFLFSPAGRFSRKNFWIAFVVYVLAAVVVSALSYAMTALFPGDNPDPGEFNVEGAAALPFIVLILGYNVLATWSGICVGIKRYHDRDKSGWWVLIALVPVIGLIWYLVEAGFLRGTAGPNRFGADPTGV